MINILGAEGQGHELNEWPSTAEINANDTPGEKESGMSANETLDDSEYDYPEVPEAYEYPDQSTSIYASVNAGCVAEGGTPICTPTGNFYENFLENNYTAPKADRDNEDVHIYKSLRLENAENNEIDDQEYVNIPMS